MQSVSVSDLQGEALDWAVAKAEGLVIRRDPMGFGSGSESGYWIWEESGRGLKRYGLIGREYSPSTKWSEGGPIIDALRECGQHQFSLQTDAGGVCVLSRPTESISFRGCGETVLIAAMRCYVAVKLGESLAVPAFLSVSD